MIAIKAGVVLLLLSFQTAPGHELPVWRLDTNRSELTLQVFASGVLSPLLHDHHFSPTEWSGTVRFDPDRPHEVSVDVTIAADSLRNDQPALSAEDHEKVKRQVQGPDILDVERHPEIHFVGKQLEVQQLEAASLQGVLHGMLTLRGQTAPVELRVHAVWSADRLNVNATSSFPQSAFGIEPYRRLLGTIAVRDEVQVELSIQAIRQ